MKAIDLLAPHFPAQSIPDIEVHTLTENAQKADANAILVCIRGARNDGHDFAAQAYAHGCRLFVAQKELSLPNDATVLNTTDTRRMLAILARNFYGDPSRKMHVIGITGTKGKTTTAQLLVHILNCEGIPCGYVGTNGIAFADRRLPTLNTTPDAVTLQRTLCDMLDHGVRTAVIEVSSQALMQHRVAGMRFETVIFTNLSPDHIGENEHPDMEHYKSCKRRLFSEFEARTAVYNADDAASAEMLEGTTAICRIACSTKQADADLFTRDVNLLRDEQMLGVSFDVVSRESSLPCRLPLTGCFNACNALLSLAVAEHVFGIPLSRATAALSDAAVEGRSEIVPLPNGATAVIDYAHNGVSLAQLLSTLREYAPSRLIVLFGSVGGRSQMRRAELGAVAACMSDLAILTSDNPADESPASIISDIARAFVGSTTPYLAIEDREDAIRQAVELTNAGDILVLAGKGHETYQLVGNQKLPFCEKDILSDIIKYEKQRYLQGETVS